MGTHLKTYPYFSLYCWLCALGNIYQSFLDFIAPFDPPVLISGEDVLHTSTILLLCSSFSSYFLLFFSNKFLVLEKNGGKKTTTNMSILVISLPPQVSFQTR
jgi:hypothetical protein